LNPNTLKYPHGWPIHFTFNLGTLGTISSGIISLKGVISNPRFLPKILPNEAPMDK